MAGRALTMFLDESGPTEDFIVLGVVLCEQYRLEQFGGVSGESGK
jgi:hypothetical protein